MKELKLIGILILILVIAGFPLLLFLIVDEYCPIMAPHPSCSPIKQTLAEYLFFYSVFYIAIGSLWVLVLIILLILTLIMFLLKKR